MITKALKLQKTQKRLMLLEDDVYERLRTVMDPELDVNIVDLGLIYDIQVEKQKSRKAERNRVKIVMTLTTPGCPLAGSFDFMVRDSLRDLPGLDVEEDVEIELTFDPPWTQELMSDEVKAELGFD